jgi:hypothetical protein
MNKFETTSYKVEIDQGGRGGRVSYMENQQSLSFDWELSLDGADIFVPTPEQWDAYCRNSAASWAEGRRQEILERVAEETRRERARDSHVTIEDRWIHFDF